MNHYNTMFRPAWWKDFVVDLRQKTVGLYATYPSQNP